MSLFEDMLNGIKGTKGKSEGSEDGGPGGDFTNMLMMFVVGNRLKDKPITKDIMSSKITIEFTGAEILALMPIILDSDGLKLAMMVIMGDDIQTIVKSAVDKLKNGLKEIQKVTITDKEEKADEKPEGATEAPKPK